MIGARISQRVGRGWGIGLAASAAMLLVSCGGQSGAASSPAGAAAPSAKSQPVTSGSASASASPAGSASSSASPSSSGGQLGMIFEVNNVGWQKVLNTPKVKGMVVVMVVPGQPGAKAGMAVGDVVTKMNGVEVRNANVTNREIRKLKVGDKVSFDLQRKDAATKVDLTVEGGQNPDIAGILNDAIKKNGNDAAAYFLRAAYADKDTKSAMGDYGKAIELNSSFVSAFVQRGTLEQSNNQDQAMKDFDTAISLDPNYEPAYVNRSVLQSARKDYGKALDDDKKAIALDATDPAAYTNLGIGYVNQGNSAEAIAAENQALTIDSQFGPALLYRGLMYRDASRVDLENATRLLHDDNLLKLAEKALQQQS